MTTLTIRIDETLKAQAFDQAEKMGIPLTLIIKNALKNFIKAPKIIIGEEEVVFVNKEIQNKMDKIGAFLSKKI